MTSEIPKFKSHWFYLQLTTGGLIIALGTKRAIEINSELSCLIIISLSVLILSAFLMQKSINVFNLRRLTIPGFWYIIYLAIIFFPALFVYMDQSHPARYRYLIGVESVLVTVPLGILFANASLRFSRREVERYYALPIQETSVDVYFPVFSIILFGTICLTLLFFHQLKSLPLHSLLKDHSGYSQIVQLREASNKLSGERFTSPLLFYAYHLLRALIYPYVIVIAFGFYLRSRHVKWLLFFCLALIFGLFYALSIMAKAPITFLFLLLFLFFFLYRGGRTSKKFVAVALGSTTAIPLFVTYLLSAGTGASYFNVLKGSIARLFFSPSYMLYFYFEIFPDNVPYLYGRTIGKLALLLGKETFHAPNYAYRYIFPGGLQSGSANAAFIGSLNADFGMLGVFLGGVLAGFLMQAIQIHLLRTHKTILNIGVYSFLIVAFSLLNITALPVVLLSNGVIFVLILSFTIKASTIILRGAGESINRLSP